MGLSVSMSNPTDKNQNNAVNAVHRLCQQVRNNGHNMYMDQWFSSPKLFNHLETYKTTAEGMGGGKIVYQRQNFSAI